MRLGFLYAGQGSQRVGMGKDFYGASSFFREIFDRARVDFDLKSLCFDGPEDMLSRTLYTQPCLLAFAAGVTAMLYEQGIKPEMAAGLSLGEYSALYAAGVFDFETAMDVIVFRARAMETAVSNRKTAMIAVLQLERERVAAACAEASELGICEPANYNCPGQIVIGGDYDAVYRAAEIAAQMGARRCMPLNVSGPFHTSLMAPAGDAMRERLGGIELSDMNFPVIFNCTGDFLREGETVAGLLERQVRSSVYLEDTIRRMAGCGIDTIIEIGPGKTLNGFVRKTAKGIQTYSVDTYEDYEKLLEALKGAV